MVHGTSSGHYHGHRFPCVDCNEDPISTTMPHAIRRLYDVFMAGRIIQFCAFGGNSHSFLHVAGSHNSPVHLHLDSGSLLLHRFRVPVGMAAADPPRADRGQPQTLGPHAPRVAQTAHSAAAPPGLELRRPSHRPRRRPQRPRRPPARLRFCSRGRQNTDGRRAAGAAAALEPPVRPRQRNERPVGSGSGDARRTRWAGGGAGLGRPDGVAALRAHPRQHPPAPHDSPRCPAHSPARPPARRSNTHTAPPPPPTVPTPATDAPAVVPERREQRGAARPQRPAAAPAAALVRDVGGAEPRPGPAHAAGAAGVARPLARHGRPPRPARRTQPARPQALAALGLAGAPAAPAARAQCHSCLTFHLLASKPAWRHCGGNRIATKRRRSRVAHPSAPARATAHARATARCSRRRRATGRLRPLALPSLVPRRSSLAHKSLKNKFLQKYIKRSLQTAPFHGLLDGRETKSAGGGGASSTNHFTIKEEQQSIRKMQNTVLRAPCGRSRNFPLREEFERSGSHACAAMGTATGADCGGGQCVCVREKIMLRGIA